MRGLSTSKPLFTPLTEGELRKILEIVKMNPNDYFLGIRDEYINIYYMGGSLLKISCSSKGKHKIEFNPKYLYGLNKLIPDNDASVDDWIKVLSNLKSHVENFQKGSKLNNKHKKEKIIQQAILINNNLCINSDYFITDMEYSCPKIGYGRFDYIALKKNKNRDLGFKYQLALMELKCGTGAFGTAFSEKNGITSYGSGIVGHAYNFSRFVYGEKVNNSFKRKIIGETGYETLEFLRKEIVNILRNKYDLGLLDADIGTIEEKDIDIYEDNIETLLICVSCEDEEKTKNTIRKYFGGNEKAKYNIGDLKIERKIHDKFKLKCLVTKDDILNSLQQQQFINL